MLDYFLEQSEKLEDSKGKRVLIADIKSKQEFLTRKGGHEKLEEQYIKETAEHYFDLCAGMFEGEITSYYGHTAIIAGYDYSIGMTLRDPYGNGYFLCVNAVRYDDNRRGTYERLFRGLTEQIHYGCVTMVSDVAPTREAPSAKTCPFNQGG